MGQRPGEGGEHVPIARDSQESLWQSQFLVTPKKAKRLEGSWARGFPKRGAPPD